MRIGIVGAGAVGSVVGGLLARGGHDITLIDPWPEHISKIQRDGLIIETPRENAHHPSECHPHL